MPIKKAYKIACDTLRDRYTETGILAGKSHFSDIWIRDCCFAAFGSLSVGDLEIVKTSITTILVFMHKSGQVPLRIGQPHILLKFMGFDAKIPKARFKEDKGVSVSTDNNSLLMIVAEQYISQAKDKEFAKEYFEEFKKVIDWNFTQDRDDDLLIEEGSYAGWADSLKKKGKVLYTNVLHCKAADSFAKICGLVGNEEMQDHYHRLHLRIKDKINTLFWNGNYYIDWLDGGTDYFSTDGNVLAILYDIASPDHAKKIQESIVKFKLDETFTARNNFPSYKPRHIYPLFLMINMGDYHNGLEWLWLGCIDAASKYKIGRKKEAKQLLNRISEKIVEYNGVYEVYEDGKPVKRLFYKSEQFFAWSSGLFVWACNECDMDT
ncbi:MAG: glycogen debranching enzyme [Candidatus Marinamargulisbacteria bacterium]|jgi:glycogen debranching enzyme